MADIDLERTGTRSRRQTHQQPNAYSISYSSSTADSKSSRHSMKHLFQSRLLLSLCCCVFALTLLFNFKYSSNYSIDQDSIRFNDSSQYTDYALLEQLLLQGKSI
jgi:ATP/ADP translocase